MIPYELELSDRAKREIRRAAVWWYLNRPKARGLFDQELGRGFQILETAPHAGAQAETGPGDRKLLLEAVSYWIYYRVDDRRRRLRILSIWHTSRITPRLHPRRP